MYGVNCVRKSGGSASAVALLRGPALVALLGHALNGNNVEQMQSAFNDIQEYLFNR